MDKLVNMRISFELRAIQASFAKYFDEQHEQVNEIIKQELAPERVLLELKEAVGKELRYLVANALRNSVQKSVEKNNKLQKILQKEVDKMIKKGLV